MPGNPAQIICRFQLMVVLRPIEWSAIVFTVANRRVGAELNQQFDRANVIPPGSVVQWRALQDHCMETKANLGHEPQSLLAARCCRAMDNPTALFLAQAFDKSGILFQNRVCLLAAARGTGRCEPLLLIELDTYAAVSQQVLGNL